MEHPVMETEDRLGAVLDGKYRIEACIGVGGMGSVYKAFHLGLGTTRAVKVMRRELAEDTAFVARFQNEARIAARLRHPHLVALYDVGQLADGTWYSVSEFVVGETLAARVASQGRFDGQEVARLLGQIADGLASAHALGIVHRDISPDNIMVTRTDTGADVARLLDFGIAKEVSPEVEGKTGSGLLLGKVGFASPEQMGLLPHGEEIDARADVFALCVVAYYMLTAGALPWRRDRLQSYIHDLLVRPEAEIVARISAEIPRPWQPTLRSGLARHRRHRVPTMPALRSKLEAAAGAQRPAALVSPRAHRGRGRWLLLLGAGLAGAALAARHATSPSPLGAPAPIAPVPTSSSLGPAPTPLATAALRAVDTTSRTSGRAPSIPVARVPTIQAAREAAAAPPSPVEPQSATASSSLSVAADVWMLVSIDGGSPQQTPFRIEDLASGPHVLVATRAGYRDIRLDVVARAGEAQRLALTPERAPFEK
jgi:serine/threonine protein kinase